MDKMGEMFVARWAGIVNEWFECWGVERGMMIV